MCFPETPFLKNSQIRLYFRCPRKESRGTRVQELLPKRYCLVSLSLLMMMLLLPVFCCCCKALFLLQKEKRERKRYHLTWKEKIESQKMYISLKKNCELNFNFFSWWRHFSLNGFVRIWKEEWWGKNSYIVTFFKKCIKWCNINEKSIHIYWKKVKFWIQKKT